MFPCTKCGCCCRRIGKIKDAGFNFPYSADKDGVCEMLEDNKCKVYDNRPILCNVEKYAESEKINKADFFKENIKACNEMMDEDNIPLQYRII